MSKEQVAKSEEMHVPKVSSLAVAVATRKKFAPGAFSKSVTKDGGLRLAGRA